MLELIARVGRDGTLEIAVVSISALDVRARVDNQFIFSNAASPKIHELGALLELDAVVALAEAGHRGVRRKQHPRFDQGTSIESQPALHFWAERIESMRASWSPKRDRLDHRQGRFREIHALMMGIEACFAL
ncbi:MAG TPA: hypothetical protein VF534_33460 [Paraburkholderia sp.]